MPNHYVKSHSVAVRLYALTIGLIGHCVFLLAVASMMYGIYFGLQTGRGNLDGAYALAANCCLVLQFPFLHSFLLGAQGRTLLKRLSPESIGADMVTTWFAFLASLQLVALFLLWTPIGEVSFEFTGHSRTLSNSLYALSWLFLAQTMFDADLSLQTGAKGWFSVVRNRKPSYALFPKQRTFRVCRQPIYLAFALILWTAPVWTIDRLLLASVWSLYCVIGPVAKEKRFLKLFGESYREYQGRVPYLIPRFYRQGLWTREHSSKFPLD